MVYIVFLLSLFAVTKGADWLVEGAVNLAKHWNVSQIVIGATIVSLGTTVPEALIATFAAVQNKSEVIVGTALGSILFNTAVILGLAAVIRPLHLKGSQFFYKAGSMVGVLILFGLLALDLHISCLDSLLLTFILLLFIGSNIWSGLRNVEKNDSINSTKDLLLFLLQLTLGTILVVLGAHYLLNSGTQIATLLGIPEAVIAVTLFAIGSSLPELITGITAARKGHTDLVLGNVMGANTLNIIFVISTAGLIHPFPVKASILTRDIPYCLVTMAILFFPAFFKKKIYRLQGIIALLIYFAFIFRITKL